MIDQLVYTNQIVHKIQNSDNSIEIDRTLANYCLSFCIQNILPCRWFYMRVIAVSVTSVDTHN